VDEHTPGLEVWNKIDAVDDDRRATLETIAARTPGVLTLSALTGEGMEDWYQWIAASRQMALVGNSTVPA
jgi:50S ribosomal subunit-associated GTPase HflX